MSFNGAKSDCDVPYFTMLISTFLLIVGFTIALKKFEIFPSLNESHLICKWLPKCIFMSGTDICSVMVGSAMAAKTCGGFFVLMSLSW